MLERANRAVTLRPRPENNSRCSLHMKRIQFASAESVEKVGARHCDCGGTADCRDDHRQRRDRLRPDEDGAFHEPRAGDGLARGRKQVGDRVAKGDLLALIDAAEVGRLKSELLAGRFADAT